MQLHISYLNRKKDTGNNTFSACSKQTTGVN